MEIVFAITLMVLGIDQGSGVPIFAPTNAVEMTLDECISQAKVNNATEETGTIIVCMPLLPKASA